MQLPALTLIEPKDRDGLTHWKAVFPSGKAYLVLTLEHGTLALVRSWERRREIRSVQTLRAIRAAIAASK